MIVVGRYKDDPTPTDKGANLWESPMRRRRRWWTHCMIVAMRDGPR
jgi:hypothetical protein